jgi:hypothetical protein
MDLTRGGDTHLRLVRDREIPWMLGRLHTYGLTHRSDEKHGLTLEWRETLSWCRTSSCARTWWTSTSALFARGSCRWCWKGRRCGDWAQEHISWGVGGFHGPSNHSMVTLGYAQVQLLCSLHPSVGQPAPSLMNSRRLATPRTKF